MIKIRAITENDWEDLKSVRLASLKEAPEAFGVLYSDAINYTPEDWKIRASDKEEPRFFLAYKENYPVGITGGIFSSGQYELISMWVAPECRGTKISVLLVEAIQHHAVKSGHSGVIVKVSPENKRACGLYNKCGFSFVNETEVLASDNHITLQKMVWSAS